MIGYTTKTPTAPLVAIKVKNHPCKHVRKLMWMGKCFIVKQKDNQNLYHAKSEVDFMDQEIILNKLKKHTPAILGSESFAKYAVLLPLIQKTDGIHVLFEVRSLDMRRQPGEICFPGGRIDSEDTDEKEAAIRETIEELGIKREEIANIFPIDYLISPYGMIIYPFAGFIKSSKITVNPAEVGEIFTVPLSYLKKTPPKVYRVNFKAEPEEDFPLDLLVGGQNYQWRPRQMDEYFYIYEGKVIWGLTARILSHFIDILN